MLGTSLRLGIELGCRLTLGELLGLSVVGLLLGAGLGAGVG